MLAQACKHPKYKIKDPMLFNGVWCWASECTDALCRAPATKRSELTKQERAARQLKNKGE